MITPSEYQLAIWEHMRARPEHLVVEALAGTGKTSTLIGGLEHLLYGDVMLTSFGVDIVDELELRIPSGSNAKARTISSLGRSAIMRWIKPANREPDRKKLTDHTMLAIANAGIAPTNTMTFIVARAVERAKNRMISTPEAASALLQQMDIVIPKSPEERFTDLEAGAIVVDALMRCATDVTRYDFADMIWLPLVRNLPMRQYQHMLVDEAQDLSPAQIMLVRQMVAPGGRLQAIGDRFQSLYQFRDADSLAMSRIIEGVNARTLSLPISWRCPARVIVEAQKYVPAIQVAPGAPPGVVETIHLDELAEMVDPGDFVLSRSNAPLAKVGAELKMAGIPVVQLGHEIGEQYVDLIVRSKTTTVEALREWLDRYLEERLETITDGDAIEAIKDKIETIKNFSLGFDYAREVVKYIRNVYTDDVKEKSVILSTVHRAKGKEAKRVFLLWESFLRRDGDEERHIAYVAVTRSASELYYVEGNLYER